MTARLVPVVIAAALTITGCAVPEEGQEASQAAKGSAQEATTTPAATAAAATATPKPKPKATPKPKPKPKSKKTQLRQALARIDASGYVGKLKLIKASVGTGSVKATFKTPEGGFEGASTKDLDNASAAVFQTVYGKVRYPTNQVVIVFQGGLVSKVTGQDLPHEETGSYSMSKSQADEIDWKDSDAQFIIDWSYYRDFAHPALKQD